MFESLISINYEMIDATFDLFHLNFDLLEGIIFFESLELLILNKIVNYILNI